MTVIEQTIQTLEIVKEEEIAAPVDVVFETILEQMGPYNEVPERGPMPMVLEAWPVGGGFATWGTMLATGGAMCRRSSRRRCSRYAGRCSCRTRRPQTCSTGSQRRTE